MRKKIFKTKYLLFTLIIFVIVSAPFIVQARGLVPCGGAGEELCNLCFVFKLLENVMNFLVNTVGVIATLFLVVGGIVLVVSGANKGLYETGKKIITNTIIGTAIVLIAWIGINTILTISGFSRMNIGLTGNWFELQCNTAAGITTPGAVTPAPDGQITPPPGGIVPSPGGIQGETPSNCTPCVTASGGWNVDECKIAIQASTPQLNFSGDKTALIKSIMWQESKAKLDADRTEPDGKQSCGPMQVLTGDKSCAELKNKTNAVAYGVDFLNNRVIPQTQTYLNKYKKEDDNDFALLELIAAAYNGGGGANAESTDCGPGKNCDRVGLTRFPNPVPKWYCLYDSATNCGLNTGYDNLRTKYVPNIIAAYNKYSTPQCQNQ